MLLAFLWYTLLVAYSISFSLIPSSLIVKNPIFISPTVYPTTWKKNISLLLLQPKVTMWRSSALQMQAQVLYRSRVLLSWYRLFFLTAFVAVVFFLCVWFLCSISKTWMGNKIRGSYTETIRSRKRKATCSTSQSKKQPGKDDLSQVLTIPGWPTSSWATYFPVGLPTSCCIRKISLTWLNHQSQVYVRWNNPWSPGIVRRPFPKWDG